MKKSFLLFCFLLIPKLLCSQVMGDEKIVIAILDEGVDYEHPELSAKVDREILIRERYITEKGYSLPLFDLNRINIKNFKKSIDQNLIPELIKFMNSSEKVEYNRIYKNAKYTDYLNLLIGNIKSILDPKHSENLKILNNYLHGTHVTGIAVKNLNNVSFINFPMSFVFPKAPDFSSFSNFNPEHNRAFIRKNLLQITNILKRNKVRIFSIPLVIDEELNLGLINQMTLEDPNSAYTDEEKKELAYKITLINIEELSRFFTENPETIFVQSSGNENRKIGPDRLHSARISTNNLVKVTAVHGNESLADFANYSSQYIDIGALGIARESTGVDGSYVYMSGTSQAAPLVTNALAKIISENPTFTPAEAIKYLFDHKTTTNETLTEVIANGRVLQSDNENIQRIKKATKHIIKIEYKGISKDKLEKTLNRTAKKLLAKNQNIFEVVYTKNGQNYMTEIIKAETNGYKIIANIFNSENSNSENIENKDQIQNPSFKSCRNFFSKLF